MTEPKTPTACGIQLSKLWIASGQTFPVDVKMLALEVTKQRFQDPIGLVVPHGVTGIDGMLSWHEKKKIWCVSYDENIIVPGRINFTLAHELGHYFCHRQRQVEFPCGQGDMLDYQGAVSQKMENDANVFASYLLMPATDFRQEIGDQAITLELLGHMADRYQTSFTATALKWLELTHEAAMLVVARDEFVCWSYTSQLAFSKRAWLASGTPVPESAIERIKSAVNHSGNSCCRVPTGIWHPSLEAEESVIISDQFDLMIFLVRYPDAHQISHDEEPETDTFDTIQNASKGFNWSK